jgi:hypothetical protein
MTHRDVVQHGESPEPHDEHGDLGSDGWLEDDMEMGALTQALRAPGTPAELQHEESAVAAFVAERRAPSGTAPVVPLAPRRPVRRTAAVVGGVAAGVLLLSGIAAAATGSLPGPLQRFAHSVIGAPEPAATTSSVTVSSRPSGSRASGVPVVSTSGSPTTKPASTPSSATGPGALGLCTAFLRDSKPVAAKEHSQAYAALVVAAAAHSQSVTSYCTSVTHPTGKPAPSTSASSHGGKPATPPGQVKKTATPAPSGNGNGHPTGKPSPNPKPSKSAKG